MPLHEFDVNRMTPGERYRLLIGAIVPRPIAFVSTVSREGATNLAPYSFYNGVGAEPMLVMFCPANNADGSPKDSLVNALPTDEGGTGVFVVNVASERYERKVAAAGEALAHGESEFELTGLTPMPAAAVAAPRVAESPVGFECETERVIRFAGDAPGGANLVIGRVVHAWADASVSSEVGHVDPAKLAAIGRMGGPDYVRTRERFALPRGRAAMQGPAADAER
jgi:flavin reductase (DIM6/NTAB) family NADH-FMN oxidoreductase RutF